MRIKNISIILSVFLCFVLFFKLLFSYPSIFLNSGFDGQTILVWKYAAQRGLLPFRDVFYPYGLLNYYVYIFPLFTILNAVVSLGIALFLLFCFLRVFSYKMYALFCFFLVMFIGIFNSGIQAFSRYGVSVTIVLLITIIMFQRHFAKRLLFLLGVIAGSFVFLIVDQGLYIFVTILLLALMGKILGYRWGQKYLVFLVGFCCAVVIFIFIFQTKGILEGFTVQLLRMSDISLYAKTPYFHSLRNPNEILNVLALSISVWYVTYVILFRRKIVDMTVFVMLSLSVLFFLIEQKSIIRFLGYQVDFISITLLSFLGYRIIFSRLKKLESYLMIPTFISLVLFVSFLLARPLPGYTPGVLKQVQSTVKNPVYKKIVKFLKSKDDFNNKLFTLPNDPVLYVVMGQNPPYFFSTYDGSPKYAQEKSIEYIITNKIKYVIYNTQASPLQDGVPDSIRAPYLYRYVFKNYKPIKFFGSYVVLRRA